MPKEISKKNEAKLAAYLSTQSNEKNTNAKPNNTAAASAGAKS